MSIFGSSVSQPPRDTGVGLKSFLGAELEAPNGSLFVMLLNGSA